MAEHMRTLRIPTEHMAHFIAIVRTGLAHTALWGQASLSTALRMWCNDEQHHLRVMEDLLRYVRAGVNEEGPPDDLYL